MQSYEQDPWSIHYSQISIIRSKGPIIKSRIQPYTQRFWGRFCKMKGKLGNKIIFEERKTLWPMVLTFNLPMLLYPYTYRHLQYSSKLLTHLGVFPLPQCWFGYASCLLMLQNTNNSTVGKEGHISVRIKVQRVNIINLRENSEIRCLFQRFLMSIVGRGWARVCFIKGSLS